MTPKFEKDHERSGYKSCSLAKGGKSAPEFVDPRTLPELPSLTRVRLDGRIEADAGACRTAERSASDVEKTIEILGLNTPRLQRARKDYWGNLQRMMTSYQRDSKAMKVWAQTTLLPEKNGNLRKFFTTSRSYFGELSEVILAERGDWV